MLRPRPARWFEILTARDDATLVLEALARTGMVELEPRPATAAGVVAGVGAGVGAGAGSGDCIPAGLSTDLQAVMPLMAQFLELAARYRAYWPEPSDCPPSAFPESPGATLQRCLSSLRAWAHDAEPLIRSLQRGDAQADDLQRWLRVLAALEPTGLDPGHLATAGPLLQVQLVVLPVGATIDAAPTLLAPGLETLSSTMQIGDAPHLLVAGSPEALSAMAQRASTLKGHCHAVPEGLQTDAAANRTLLDQRLAAIATERVAAESALAGLGRQHDLPRTLGDAHRLQWLLNNVPTLESGALFCWITGWCNDSTGGQPGAGQADPLALALQGCTARALLHHPPAPPGLRPPLLLRNPPWARPFEIFSRALGMPAAAEADPTPLLAIVVPLMFGYMFGDVGQGLLLAAVGGWYRRRFAIARLLMVGGLSATVFGLLFGSLFGLHGLLPALWLHPLEAPLTVLLAPLLGGALLLTLGLGLDALAAWWRGDGGHWLLTDAWLVVVYGGLLAAFVSPAGLPVASAAALAYCAGHAVADRRLSAGFAAIGELIEKTLQILINTLSFARVGAFALAHAGLSSAIVALMDAADSGIAKALVLVLGNAVVIVLEAMVVSIQTTRLVLFEFFTRFMQGTGRAFRPLPAPPFITQERPR